MAEIIDIRVSPEQVDDKEIWKQHAIRKLKKPKRKIIDCILVKRSIDARGSVPKFQLRIKVYFEGEAVTGETHVIKYLTVSSRKRVIIIGAGPCGYFAALRCIELGLCPIILERGKDVRSRRRDLRQIQQFDEVNPDSNYCFGEGGAGTYSDGKLYTRSVKRGNVRKMLEILVQHGADAHPHIGSNKLPQIVGNIRDTIISAGGEVHFDTRVVDFVIDQGKILGARSADDHEYKGAATILCTGHSARDIYRLCATHDLDIEFKPFAVGMRLEHPQALIDEIQYNRKDRGKALPAASYSLSCQVDGAGVFSFCMCPGGLIVPAATSPGELVVNGMSLSRRDSPYANAAMVVAIDHNPRSGDPFGGMMYQEGLEQHIFDYGDGSQSAPAQRITDFVEGKISTSLSKSSYIPGIYPGELHQLLPQYIVEKIRRSLKIFDRRMRGYYTEEAQFVGLESRTSAPIRIPRDKDTLMHADLEAFFPGGEGAGYAGGILSAALDGERLAEAVSKYLDHQVE